ncbi:GNAT family N-acetyltransferase [Lysinibacillus xylanilyticus]|uniref:GNAT family N-acetyltransferase n=1 Tax=Lysinibacillus xylanilyticus TaxID=582475 RepID=A0ABT4EUT9_9BACI|nr:GNAT family N-acetyltransferase [Lysinibacillus xylanilyticus]MCY9549444.1 GNAT family N-acetyltransferase [Lysinibacillus xylanilyticus]
MSIVIKRTNETEAPILLEIQKEAFEDDLRKYEDHDTSPVNEPIERLLRKIELFIHYTIWHNNVIIGGIDVRDLKDNKYRLNRLFISKKYQNKGLGSQIMKLVEKEFPSAVEWVLDTPHLNIRNHHFYEKLGYKKIGQHQINEKLVLFDYTKIVNT